MAKALQEILGYVPLTGIIQSTTTGIPDPLPESFARDTVPTDNDIGRYTKVTGTRKTARQVMYGAPALNRELKDVSEQDVKLLHSFEKIQINVATMNLLRNYTNYDQQQRGTDEVNRQVLEFKQLFKNLELGARLFALSLGKIYFDSGGNLLPSSSGAAVTVDYGVNSTTNQGQLQDVAGATIISASWDITTTNIPKNIRTIKKTARRRTGYPLKYALYGENIPSYIAKNDFVKDWFTRNPGKNQEYLDTGELPQGMMGLTWIPAFEAFYEDASSTFQDVWTGDEIVFCPEPSRDWWETMEGTYPVPTTYNIQPGLAEANNSFNHVRGMFSFAKACENPPAAADLFAGHTFLPLLKVPNAVFQADVTP